MTDRRLIPPAAGQRADARGFTLVEMLVSLALLGMAATMLLSGIAMGGMWTRRAADGGDNGAVAAVQFVLRERLERLAPITRLDAAEPIVDAWGSSTSFDFVAVAPDRDRPEALQRYRITRTADGELRLYAANTLDPRIDAGDKAMIGWRQMHLLAGTSALSVSFFGADLRNGGRQWQSSWGDHQQPPDLVRLQVEFPAGDRRVWPEFVVRPHATLNTACNIEPAHGRCGATL
jgi:general secretion pathway protein J